MDNQPVAFELSLSVAESLTFSGFFETRRAPGKYCFLKTRRNKGGFFVQPVTTSGDGDKR
jgi:hypothetical protein